MGRFQMPSIKTAFVFFITFIVTIPVYAFPSPSITYQAPQRRAPSPAPLDERFDYTGIVALAGCSASLVRFEDSNDDDDALILTNGHCVRMIPPNQALYDLPSKRYAYLLRADGKTEVALKTDRLIYATMTKTDLAIYKLPHSYRWIRDNHGIEALTIANQAPSIGIGIEVASGFHRRIYQCEIEAFAYQLREGDWLFDQAIRYSRPGCEVIGGTSGSPVLALGSRIVVAINNTINENGFSCRVGNPCEIDENGNINFERGFAYAQQVHELYGCRELDGSFNFNQKACMLPKP